MIFILRGIAKCCCVEGSCYCCCWCWGTDTNEEQSWVSVPEKIWFNNYHRPFPIYLVSIYVPTGVLPTYLLVSYQPKYHLLVSCLPIYWYPICLSTYLHCVFSTYLLVSYLPIYWCRRYLFYSDLSIYLLVSYLPPCLVYQSTGFLSKRCKKTYFFSHRLNHHPSTMKFISQCS